MRRLRKNTIFRVYLFFMCAAFCLSGYGALMGQRRFYLARLDRLDHRLSDLTVSLYNVSNTLSSVSVSQVDQGRDSSTASPARDPDPFWIEGHGYNKRYAYLDICFPDGYRARYYFRPFPSREELASLHRRIHHDADIHSFVLDEFDEDT